MPSGLNKLLDDTDGRKIVDSSVVVYRAVASWVRNDESIFYYLIHSSGTTLKGQEVERVASMCRIVAGGYIRVSVNFVL